MHNESGFDAALDKLGIGNPLNGIPGPESPYLYNGEVVNGDRLLELYNQITSNNPQESDGEVCRMFASAVFDYLKEQGLNTITTEPTFFATTSNSISTQYAAAYHIPPEANFMTCAIPATQYYDLAAHPFAFDPVHIHFQLTSPQGEFISNVNDTQTALYFEAMGAHTYFGVFVPESINLTQFYNYYLQNLINPEQGVLSFENFVLLVTQGLPGIEARAATYEDPSQLVPVSEGDTTVMYPTILTVPGTLLYFPIRSDGTWDYKLPNGETPAKQPFVGQFGPSPISAPRIVEGITNSVVTNSDTTIQAPNTHIQQPSQAPALIMTIALVMTVAGATLSGIVALTNKVAEAFKKTEENKQEDKK